jgi:hypothetical protein
MVVQIPVKKKYMADKGMYGYKAPVSGNSNRKVKKTGVKLGGEPYDKTKHILVVEGSGKRRWRHL